MKKVEAEFVKSVTRIDELPKQRLKEIAFAGRSNVGKSSLINSLLQKKNLAKTSSTPGKTRQLNYFRINRQFYFVDLPGYGYAKVSSQERQKWKQLIEQYFRESKDLKGVVSLVDCRIGATELDLQLLEWLKSLNIPAIVVATKSDKLSRSAMLQQIRKLTEQLQYYTQNEIIPYSSVTGMGKKELWKAILTLLE